MGTRSGSSLLNAQTVAVAGSTQATATLLSVKAFPAIIATAGNAVGGVRLPPATEGKIVFIKNTGDLGGLANVYIYPATGDAINALGTNNPFSLADLKSVILAAINATQWYTFPLTP